MKCIQQGFECPGQESNLHALRHTHLKRARLPIPPPGPIFSTEYSEQKIGFKPLRIYRDWCPEQDSNLHAVNRHYPLKVACLPISPSGLKYLCAAEIEVQSLNFKGKTISRDHPRAVCLPSTNLKLTTNLNEPKTSCAKIRHQYLISKQLNKII